ncbi:MAG: 1-acyl-sn-glycerol-3-phosphate acyltransferase [Niabella sp.]
MRFFCYSINVNKTVLLKSKGPLLIASNHPNSFLDAIIYDILFDVPIWSLARGDVFKRFPTVVPFLNKVKIFPIYRTREGAANLSENYKTFDACMEVFSKKEAVTIFSEALCVNEWHLRPLRKGTARIAFMAWQNQMPLQVLPAGINYSSFRRFGKQVDVNLGTPITQSKFDMNDSDGNRNLAFNKELQHQLSSLVYEIKPGDNKTFDEKFKIHPQPVKEIVLFIPAAIAAITHAPIYFAAKLFVKKLVNNNDHYDSLLLSFLLFTYPFYLLLFTGISWAWSRHIYSLLLLVVLPLTVLAYVKRRVRKDRSFRKRK